MAPAQVGAPRVEALGEEVQQAGVPQAEARQAELQQAVAPA